MKKLKWIFMFVVVLFATGCTYSDNNINGNVLQHPENPHAEDIYNNQLTYSTIANDYECQLIYSSEANDCEYPTSPRKIAIITLDSTLTFDSHWADDWIAELAKRHGEENLLIYAWPRSHNFTSYETFDMINDIQLVCY